MIGALLVTASVVGLFVASGADDPPKRTEYLVVAEPVPAGHRLTDDDIVALPLDLGHDLGGRTLLSGTDVVGSIAVQTLLPGQLLQRAMLAQPTEDDGAAVELSFALPRSHAVDADLVPGDVVDIVATIDRGAEACTAVVAADARIVSIGGGDADLLTSRSGELTVTVSLDEPARALTVVHAVDEATVTLVRATRAQQVDIDGTWCTSEAVSAEDPS